MSCYSWLSLYLDDLKTIKQRPKNIILIVICVAIISIALIVWFLEKGIKITKIRIVDKKQIKGCYMEDEITTLPLGENRGNWNYKPK